jgi:hypothetical protein
MCLISGGLESVCGASPAAPDGRPGVGVRAAVLDRQMRDGTASKDNAVAKARRAGMKVRGRRDNGSYFELVGMEGNHPLFFETYNRDAAISTGADLLMNLPIYDGLDGTGILVGVWDAGSIRPTHHEFGPGSSRVIKMTNEPNDPHATHVGGTIAAYGEKPLAKGMAPKATLRSYYMSSYGTSDYVQMEQAGAKAPGQSNKLYLSNHSYGYTCGWTWTDGVPEWVGKDLIAQRDWVFGLYGAGAAGWDAACYADPYYLPFKAAGNDRDDLAPVSGQSFFRWETQVGIMVRVWYVYDPLQHPPADGSWYGGYDTIPDVGTAKNIVTVGAVDDAVTNYTRDITKAAMTSFSGWGPTDDGRVKPDIVANGTSLYSSGWYEPNDVHDPNYVPQGDTSYFTMSGTSMACPNACGSAALLVQLYSRLFPGQAMLSSTLKGAIIHTADDLGTPGPDYAYGWGLMNARASADLIMTHHQEPLAGTFYEGRLNGRGDWQTFTFRREGTGSVRVTLCWTDVPGSSVNTRDSRAPNLVHDLDLRVVDVNGVISQPYVLDYLHPTWPATRGDNTVDNVEVVDVAPGLLHSTFTVRVSMKTNTGIGGQSYSLVVTGQAAETHPVMVKGRITDSRSGAGLAGVTVTGQPGGYTAVTRSDGVYELLVPYNWCPSPAKGTVTASRYAYLFSPATRDYNDVRMDTYEQNYAATLISPAISGKITDAADSGVSGVQIVTTPDVGSAYSDPNGGYSIMVPYGFTGTVSPERDSMAFAPESRSYSDVTSSILGQDYSTSDIFHRISGRITDMDGMGLPGVGLIADPNHGAVLTDAQGYYYIDVANHFTGVLQPVKYGYALQPVSRTYTNVETAFANQDYTVNGSFYDGFADNRRGSSWVVQSDPNDPVVISEHNQKIYASSLGPNTGRALYCGNEWRLDPNIPFTMKADFHMAVTNFGEPNDGWVGLTLRNTYGDYISYSAGCHGTTAYYRLDAYVDGNSFYCEQSRSAADGTLYITSDPNGVYLSTIEYGPNIAWQVIPGKLRVGSGRSLQICAGGGAADARIADGLAWLDDLEISTGHVTGLPPVSDVNKDGYVDWLDVTVIADHWLVYNSTADINKDGKVNFKDLARIATGW